MMDKIEKLEKVLNLVKSIFLIALYVIVALIIIKYHALIIDKVDDFAQNAEIKEASVAGFKFALKEVREEIVNDLNRAVSSSGQSDTAAKTYQVALTKQLSKIDQKLDSVNHTGKSQINAAPIKSRWVYIGSYSKDARRWDQKYVDFAGEIKTGAIGVAKTPLNVRDDFPKYESSIGWIKGKVIDGIEQNREIEVLDLKKINGTGNRDLYWVQIR